jgi:beta-fructofuranosidase
MTRSDLTRRRFARVCAASAFAAPAAFPEPQPPAGLKKAMEAVIAAIPQAERDANRPVYHFHPPANWHNDPNGTIFYRGWHHLFYQFNPYGATWGHMHWGHARSRDLVNWEHLPIALWPSPDKGEEHVFSGGAIAGPHGRPRVFYTSIGQRDPEQWMAMPVDDELMVWEKHPRNPVVTLKNHGSLQVDEWRDPFLFREGGRTYMVCGGNTNFKLGGAGAVQLYEAANPDLTEWRHRGVVFQYRDRVVWNIECPNLFKLGAQWVLLISPQNPCEYFAGSLDLARGRFTPNTHGVLDPGQSYASNISYDDRGRTLLWLWGKTDFDPAKGWQGCMTMPRVLSIDEDGFLRQSPAPEFETLRGDLRTMPATPLDPQPLPLGASFAGDCLEIEAAFTLEQADAVGLRVRVPAGGGNPAAEIAYTAGTGLFSVGAAGAPIGRRKQVHMRVFLDKGVVEAFANDGMAAIFAPLHAGPADLAVEAFARGGKAHLDSLRAWPLKPARLSLERFHV